MRSFLLLAIIVCAGSLQAQFKGSYFIINQEDTIKYLQFHSDGEYLMERLDMNIFSIEFYFNLDSIEDGEHLMVTEYNSSKLENANNGWTEDAPNFYTTASLQELSSYLNINNYEYSSYRDTLGYDLVKINKNDTLGHIYYEFKNTKHKIIGTSLGSWDLLPLPKKVKIQAKDGMGFLVELMEYERTDEKVSVPKGKDLGKYIEFEQLNAMMSMSGLGQN